VKTFPSSVNSITACALFTAAIWPSKLAVAIFCAVMSVANFDLPPLKWSSLKYYFWMEDEIDGKEKAYG
jgi:hypothetical protein